MVITVKARKDTVYPQVSGCPVVIQIPGVSVTTGTSGATPKLEYVQYRSNQGVGCT